MGQPHDQEHGHGHGPGNTAAHASLWLAPHGGRPVHRVGRRQFLTDLGRNTLAVAVLGGFVAGCRGDDDDAGDGDGATPTTGPSDSTTPPAADTPGGSLRWARVSLGFVSAYVLVRGNEAAVVDTGSSGSADQIGAALATMNATYDDVRHVVLTHSHGDHVGSLPAVLDRAVGAAAHAGAEDIPNIAAPIELNAVGDGDDVFGLEVIATPGHTPGSISVFDPGIGLLVAGDAVNGTADGTALTGANEQFSDDMDTANASVRKLAALDVEAVAMGHGEPVESGAGASLKDLAARL